MVGADRGPSAEYRLVCPPVNRDVDGSAQSTPNRDASLAKEQPPWRHPCLVGRRCSVLHRQQYRRDGLQGPRRYCRRACTGIVLMADARLRYLAIFGNFMNPRFTMSIMRFCLLLTLIAMMGCGGGTVKLPKAPVSGVVTYRGKPLSTGRVCFVHQSGQASTADLAADGTFTLSAFQGRNQVVIECLAPEKSAPGSTKGRIGFPPQGRIGFPPQESLIPTRYSECATSGLTCEVKPDENHVEFALCHFHWQLG